MYRRTSLIRLWITTSARMPFDQAEDLGDFIASDFYDDGIAWTGRLDCGFGHK